LQAAQSGVGKAVVLAHIALVAGFMVLTVSEFIPLVYFGAILSLSMVGGLISDLVLLPLLLRWTTRTPKSDHKLKSESAIGL
jgi:predicted RND superfamily exporter protein